jgi:hypothetical protein
MQQPAGTHLAQLNVGRAADEIESERMSEFIGALDRINRLAERSSGFVWRLADGEGGGATGIKVAEDPRFIINLSVWETPETLEQFAWKTVHKQYHSRRANWFEPPSEPTFVMWGVPAGHIPPPEEAIERLDHLRANGASEHAFDWAFLPDITLWKTAD